MPNSPNSTPDTLGHESLTFRNEKEEKELCSSNGNIASNNNGTRDNGDCGSEKREEEDTSLRSVIIVGGGISGLIAASVLVQNGFEVTLLEAQDRVGGRIHSLHEGEGENGIAELGAQWIHGQEGNPVYKFALDNDLVAVDPDPDDEKHGFYCTNRGQVIDSNLVNLTLEELDKIKEYCSTLTTDAQYTSLEDIFRSRFNEFKLSQVNKSTDLKVMVDQRKIKKEECSNEEEKRKHFDEEVKKQEEKKCDQKHQRNEKNRLERAEHEGESKITPNFEELTLIARDSTSIDANCIGCEDNLKVMDALLEWYFTFEKIDNACDKFSSLSIRGYTEYIDCSGFPSINLKNGYDSVINAICLKIPSKCINLNHHVNKVTYSPEMCQIIVNAQNKCSKDAHDIKFKSDHCILTVSLGVLKSELITFQPPLPEEKIKLINAMGFGTINKIFLKFDSPFWPVNSRFAIKLVWMEKHSDDKYPNWVYDMTGFDVSRNHKSTLIGWIGGQGARDIEDENEETIATVCHNLLKQFLGSNLIRKPVKVFCSKWFTNRYFRGSYSHPTRESEALSLPNSILSDPIGVKLPNGYMVPRVIIAGEATDPEYFSTTHGAFRSGERAAQQLIQFQCDIKAMKNKPKRPMN